MLATRWAARSRLWFVVLMALLMIGPTAVKAQDVTQDITQDITQNRTPKSSQESESSSRLGRRLPALEVQTLVGFDHRSRGTMPGSWAPVTVWISNHTDKELLGQLKLGTVTSNGDAGGSKVTFPVRLPAQGRVQLGTTVFVEPNDARLEAALSTSTGEAANATDAMMVAPRFMHTVVVLGEAQEGLASAGMTYPHDELTKGGQEGSTEVFPIIGQSASRESGYDSGPNRWNVLQAQLSTLPERWIAYGGVSAIVITAPASVDKLTDGQWQAILDHVRSGGHLLIEQATPQAAQDARQSVRLQKVLPARADNTPQPVERADFIAAFGGPHDAEGPMAIQPLVVRPDMEAAARCEADKIAVTEHVVVAMLPHGLGRIITTGFSLVDTRITSQANAVSSVLRQIFEFRAGAPEDFARQTTASTLSRQIDLELKSEELAQIPSHKVLLAFLLAYCLLVGPINRLFFARAGRPLAAWLVMPLIVMGFIGIALTKLSIKRPEVALMREISVIQLRDGESTALARSYLSLYSPDRATYSINYPNQDATLQYLVHAEHRGLDRETLAYADGVKNVYDGRFPAGEIAAAAVWRMDGLTLAPRSSANLEATSRLALKGTIQMENTNTAGQATIANGLDVGFEGGMYLSPSGPSFELPAIRAGEKVAVGSSANVHGLSDLVNRTGRDRKVIETIVTQLKQTRAHPAVLLWTSSSITHFACRNGAETPQNSGLTFFLVHPVKGQ